MRTGVSLWVFALALFVLAPIAARAQSDDDWRSYPSAGNGAAPLDRILPEIRRSYPGRFYDAEGPFMGGDGQMHYRVKWMTPEGRIVWLDTDARTGRVLGSGGSRHDYGNENSYGRDQGYDDRRGNRAVDERRSHFTDDNYGDRPDRGGRDWNGGDRPDQSGRDWNGGDRPDRGGRDWNGGGRDWGGGDRQDRGGRHWNGGGWGGGGDRHGHHD
jgi:hypothetical protein